MYRVHHERFNHQRGDWDWWFVDYTDEEFVQEVRVMKRRELQQNLYEDSEGELSLDEIDRTVEEMLEKYSDDELLAEYDCFKVS